MSLISQLAKYTFLTPLAIIGFSCSPVLSSLCFGCLIYWIKQDENNIVNKIAKKILG